MLAHFQLSSSIPAITPVALTVIAAADGASDAAAAPAGRLVIRQKAVIPSVGVLQTPPALVQEAAPILFLSPKVRAKLNCFQLEFVALLWLSSEYEGIVNRRELYNTRTLNGVCT